MPFLDEGEWEVISPLLDDAITEIKQYREKHKCDLNTARKNIKYKAMKKFEEITGMPDVHFEIIYHHRLSRWGQECIKCGHLLRTAKASLCANCGNKLKLKS